MFFYFTLPKTTIALIVRRHGMMMVSRWQYDIVALHCSFRISLQSWQDEHLRGDVLQKLVGDAHEHSGQFRPELRHHGLYNLMPVLSQEEVCRFSLKKYQHYVSLTKYMCSSIGTKKTTISFILFLFTGIGHTHSGFCCC